MSTDNAYKSGDYLGSNTLRSRSTRSYIIAFINQVSGAGYKFNNSSIHSFMPQCYDQPAFSTNSIMQKMTQAWAAPMKGINTQHVASNNLSLLSYFAKLAKQTKLAEQNYENYK